MKRIFLAVLAMSAVGAMVLAGAGSAAKARPGGATTAPRAAATHIGAGVVRQVGLRNYAGPNCPGKGWNCTTATRVLQVATAGGTNSFVCSPSNAVVGTPTPTNCVINQIGGTSNTARCTQQSSDASVTQTCDITQSGAANYAYVNQNINQSDGSSQTGEQIATVTQGPASATNYAQISQAANQSSKIAIGSTQTQTGYQSATVTQTATGTGTNSSQLNQTQLQKEYARGTTQNQNITGNPTDCNPNTVTTPGPMHPNVCAVVLQTSEAGSNGNQLRQNVNEDQNSTGQATQTQGVSSTDGGLDSRVHQGTDSGTSTNSAGLSKNQHQTAAPNSSQVQHDPVSCCGFASQDGGTNNVENINLSSSQSASGDSSPEQTSDLIGTSHTPTGSCTITTKASINQDSANSSDTESPCPFLTLETSCTEGECTAQAPDLSNPNPPISTITAEVKNLNHTGEVYSDSTDALAGDVVVYRVTYANAGPGTAHNVWLSAAVPPAGETLTNANLFDNVTAGLYCPQTVTLGGTCTLGPASDPGTVAPGTDPAFTTMYFAATVAPGPNCTAVTYTATGHTDEEGSLSSGATAVRLPCIL